MSIGYGSVKQAQMLKLTRTTKWLEPTSEICEWIQKEKIRHELDGTRSMLVKENNRVSLWSTVGPDLTAEELDKMVYK